MAFKNYSRLGRDAVRSGRNQLFR